MGLRDQKCDTGWRHQERPRSAADGTPASSNQFFFPKSATLSLDPSDLTATANDRRTSWCDGFSTYGVGQFGTPNAPNDDCQVTIPFEFQWSLVAGGTVQDCTFVQAGASASTSAPWDRDMSTGNGAAGGILKRYTYFRATTTADDEGQHIEWIYDVSNPTEAHYWGLREAGDPTDTVSAAFVVDFDSAIANAGRWTAPCL